MGYPKATLVLTTISDPVLLEAYYQNLSRFGRLEDIEIIVVPDQKTPEQAYNRVQNLFERGLKISCPKLSEQEAFLRKCGLRPEFVPCNSDNRRNVGYLMAYASGSDFLISIDDDNLCRDDEDFFGEHSAVCGESSRTWSTLKPRF